MKRYLRLLPLVAFAGCTVLSRLREGEILVVNDTGEPVTSLSIEFNGQDHFLGALDPGEDWHTGFRPGKIEDVRLEWTDGTGRRIEWRGGDWTDPILRATYTLKPDGRVVESVEFRRLLGF